MFSSSIMSSQSFLTPGIMAGSDWKGLELGLVRLLWHAGWKDVLEVGQAGDGGADILATRRSPSGSSESFLFQSKAVSGDGYVGQSAVAEALKAQSIYGVKTVVVATNGEFYQSVYRRRDELANAGFDVRLWNGAFLHSLAQKMPEYSAARRDLRPYQQNISSAVVSNFESGRSRSLFILATGLGKTVIAASALDRIMRQAQLSRALVVCHSVDLAAQLERAFWSQLPKSVPTRRFWAGSPPLQEPGIVFGLYQTLIQYLGSIDPEAFELIVVDEAHHALANSFATAINRLRPRHLIGMTATPWRGDGAEVESIFGEPLARVSLVDGMRMGYLARVDYRLMCDNVDWSELPRLSGKSVTVRDLNKRLFLPQRDDAVISCIMRESADIPEPRILIFSPSKKHAVLFAKLLTNAGVPAACASTDKKQDRNRILLDFSAGKIKALTAVDVLNEGIDFPDTNMLVFLRATHSRRIFVQQLGRGLRLAKEKASVKVLDFVTDLRRIAAVASLDQEARDCRSRLPTGEVERIVLKDGVVTFSDEKAHRFVDAWLEDVASLEDKEDAERLLFPESD